PANPAFTRRIAVNKRPPGAIPRRPTGTGSYSIPGVPGPPEVRSQFSAHTAGKCTRTARRRPAWAGLSAADGGAAGAGFAQLIVAAAEDFLEPDVEHDEEVAAAHLFHLQLRLAGGAVGPGGGDDGEAVAADDGLEGELDGEVEVLGEERLDSLD